MKNPFAALAAALAIGAAPIERPARRSGPLPSSISREERERRKAKAKAAKASRKRNR